MYPLMSLLILPAVGLPGTVSFIAELNFLIGGFEHWGWLVVLLSLGILVSAAYAIRTVGRLFTGPVAGWLRRHPRRYSAAVRRFWLDPLADGPLVNPTRSLARDLAEFDEKVVNRMVGLPAPAIALSSLAAWEAKRERETGIEGDIGSARGFAGRLIEWVARMLHWFEEHLLHKGGGEGLHNLIQRIGAYLTRVEQLLSRPRYLLLLIMATFLVII